MNELPQTPDISYPNADQRFKDALMRKGKLPNGDYTICVYAKETGSNEEIGNDCLEHSVEVDQESEITLLTPENNSSIEPDEPIVFSWMDPSSKGPYKIKIVEIKGDESPENAMLKNKAFFEMEDLRTTTLQYPSSAPKFVEGKKYAWQINIGENLSQLFLVTLKDEYEHVRHDLNPHMSESEIDEYIRKLKKEKQNVILPNILRTVSRTINQPCQNGGFELGDFSNWDGGLWGTTFGGLPIGIGLNLNNSGYISPSYSGSIQSDNYWGRHVILPDGNWETSGGFDPILSQLTTPFNLSVVSPNGGNFSLRLGNPYRFKGSESISQTFLVSSQNFSFSYAFVLQESHSNCQNGTCMVNGSESFFLVRILDNNQNEIYRLEEVGFANNPFISFSSLPSSNFQFKGQNFYISQKVFYRDWSCVNVLLPPDVIGENVTVEFITADCNASGHWGYAYIDNVCQGCTGTGNNNGFNGINSVSTNCVPLQVCGAYQPPVLNGVTGTLQNVTLQLYRNGSPVTTYGPFTPTINASNNTYCFNLSSSDFPSPPNPDGFDVVTTANFSLNGGTVPVSSGSLSGTVPGQNNDFFVNCLNPCDSFKASVDINSDLCCVKLNLNQPASFANLKNIVLTPISGSFVTPITNFNSLYSSNLSISTVSSSNITISPKIPNPNIIVPANGSFTNLFNICITPGPNNNSKIAVTWSDLQNNVICKDTIVVN
ncbi:MAG TPA: hypothetical protein DDY18_08095, partial [Flavobacterium sp.]|nr:hypothetical protein [Flavobacterium sp.]